MPRSKATYAREYAARKAKAAREGGWSSPSAKARAQKAARDAGRPVPKRSADVVRPTPAGRGQQPPPAKKSHVVHYRQHDNLRTVNGKGWGQITAALRAHKRDDQNVDLIRIRVKDSSGNVGWIDAGRRGQSVESFRRSMDDAGGLKALLAAILESMYLGGGLQILDVQIVVG